MQAGRISAGNAVMLARAIAAGRWDTVQSLLYRAADQAQAEDCDRVLFSSEWLLGSLAQPGALQNLVKAIRSKAGHDLELFLILREPVAQLISHYQHRAKSGLTGDLQAWAEQDYLLPRRLGALRQQLEVSDIGIVVRGYVKAQGSLEQQFFADWLGLRAPLNQPGRLVNPSLSLSELILLRRLRPKCPSLVPVLYERFLAVDPALKTEAPAMLAYAESVAGHAVARCAEEWQWWNARLPEPERFAITEPTEQPGPEPTDLTLSSAQWLVLVDLLADVIRPRFLLRLFWGSNLRPRLARLKGIVSLGRGKAGI